MDLEQIKYAHRFDNVSGSAIREIFKLIAKPGMISFAGGNPAKSALPDDVCADIAKEVLNENGKAILQYGATEGYAPLLESLRSAYDWLFTSRAGQAYMEGLPRCQIVPCAFSSEANQVGVAAAYFEAMQKKC